VTSFLPIADQSARMLILGSMPGVLSLKANQYYAHPRNAFWRIMSDICGFDVTMPYEHRVEALKASGFAVWDVLQSCTRLGSLDSAIEAGSRVTNDFESFFNLHPNIQLVGFNGTEADKSFHRYVLPNLSARHISFVRLPSTSPAHAIALDEKITAWRAALSNQ
jgi:double-stranded uracil-DNA glycosylase